MRSLAFAILLPIVPVLLVVLFEGSTPFFGETIDVLANGSNQALVLTGLSGHDEVSAARLIGRDGSARWIRIVPRVSRSTDWSPAATMGADVVLVRLAGYDRGGGLLALNLVDGSTAWSVAPGDHRREGNYAIMGLPTIYHAGAFYVSQAADGPRDGTLTAYDEKRGTKLWSATIGRGPSAGYWRSKEALVIQTGYAEDIVGLDWNTGKELFRYQQESVTREPCVLDGELWYLAGRALHRVRLLDGRERSYKLDIKQLGKPLMMGGHCGKRDGAIVFLLQHGWERAPLSLISFDPDRERLRWSLELEGLVATMHSSARYFPESGTLFGDLARFAVLTGSVRDVVWIRALAIVDLDAVRVAHLWRLPDESYIAAATRRGDEVLVHTRCKGEETVSRFNVTRGEHVADHDLDLTWSELLESSAFEGGLWRDTGAQAWGVGVPRGCSYPWSTGPK